MPDSSTTALVIFGAELLLRVGLALRILLRRLATGTTFAWLLLVLGVPLVGAAVYLMFGELRLGRRRAAMWQSWRDPLERWMLALTEGQRGLPDDASAESQGFARLAERSFAAPALDGNRLQLLAGADASMRSIVADVDAAQRTCHFEFYIWTEGGEADQVVEALLRAAARGVKCRVLIDALGSAQFLRGRQVQRLRAGNVEVRAALPVSLLRLAIARLDLRNHRKIVVIDGQIAYTGSLNMADPRYFKQSAGVGQWVDALVRVEGPAVLPLAVTFLEDWELEARVGVDRLREEGDARRQEPRGEATVQVLASGPHLAHQEMREVLMTAIVAAQREVVLTTPYFIPDDVLLAALCAAAKRGVAVTLIVPERLDSQLVAWASRMHLAALVEAGVHVAQFRGGLLHTKSIFVDGEFCLFGSLNLDLRSLVLNFEITLAIYDREFAGALAELQQSYLRQSSPLTLPQVTASTPVHRLVESLACLMAPLL